jgi:formylglycine-generating enzyme required for sulfatase activity
VVIGETGLIAGIVSLRTASDHLEAYGFAASLVREALAEYRPAAFMAGSDAQRAELRQVVCKMLQTTDQLRSNKNVPKQFTDELVAIGRMLQRCADCYPSSENLAELAATNEDLAEFTMRARQEELNCFFEDTPLRRIIDHLDEVTSKVPIPLARDGEILVDHTATNRADIRAILELLREVEEVQTALVGNVGNLDSSIRERAWRCLQRLRILLTKPKLNLGELNQARGRLEAIKSNLLERTIRLSRVVLGHYAGRLPNGAVFQDREDTPELVVIPAGRFLMGPREHRDGYGPSHDVKIPEPLALGRYPLKFEEYDRFADAMGGQRPSDEGWGRGRMSVINVSWEDAKAYLAWLSSETGKPYGLPSEGEWEYACRAGTTTSFWWGDNYPPEIANHTGLGGTFEVDPLLVNPWGLCSMQLGNFQEWLEDCWNQDYKGAPNDGTASLIGDCTRRVSRDLCFPDRRYGLDIEYRSNAVGFRVARPLRRQAKAASLAT